MMKHNNVPGWNFNTNLSQNIASMAPRLTKIVNYLVSKSSYEFEKDPFSDKCHKIVCNFLMKTES